MRRHPQRLTVLVVFTALVGGGLLTARAHARGGDEKPSSRASPVFRRIRILNASGNQIKNVQVNQVLPSATNLYTSPPKAVDAMHKDDDGNDDVLAGTKENMPLGTPFATATQKVSVSMDVLVGSTWLKLDSTELDTGAANRTLGELIILVDNHWSDPTNFFQVTLLGGYATIDEEEALTVKVVESGKLTPHS